jgi:hypothetical protein
MKTCARFVAPAIPMKPMRSCTVRVATSLYINFAMELKVTSKSLTGTALFAGLFRVILNYFEFNALFAGAKEVR